MVARAFVGGSISELPELVEEVSNLSRQQPFIGEPTKGFFESFPLALVDGVMSGHELSDKLRQLSQLDETGGRIVPEIAFRLTTERDKVRVVGGKKTKICRPDHAAREVP